MPPVMKTKPLKPVTKANWGPLRSEYLKVPSDQSKNHCENCLVCGLNMIGLILPILAVGCKMPQERCGDMTFTRDAGKHTTSSQPAHKRRVRRGDRATRLPLKTARARGNLKNEFRLNLMALPSFNIEISALTATFQFYSCVGTHSAAYVNPG